MVILDLAVSQDSVEHLVPVALLDLVDTLVYPDSTAVQQHQDTQVCLDGVAHPENQVILVGAAHPDIPVGLARQVSLDGLVHLVLVASLVGQVHQVSVD